MEDLSECVICNKTTLPNGETCIECRKGIQRLKEASQKRNDSKYLCFENSDRVFVHPTCRKHYTREMSIVADLKKAQDMSVSWIQVYFILILCTFRYEFQTPTLILL